uniref:Uncharacterized protein n=1 Tax=Hyaloperonospora arabidopsidis (strain Emoy2) TaxID=559515 RepID=M4C1Z4_HYAAE
MAVVNPERLLRRLDWSVSKLKAISGELMHTHLAAFYVFAQRIHMSKRIANIQYVFVSKVLCLV